MPPESLGTSPTSVKRGLRITDLVRNDMLPSEDHIDDHNTTSTSHEKLSSAGWGVKQMVNNFCKRAFHELSSSPPKVRPRPAIDSDIRTVKPSHLGGGVVLSEKSRSAFTKFPKHPYQVIIVSSDDHTGWLSSQASDIEYREKLRKVHQQLAAAEESLCANNAQTSQGLDISSSSPGLTTIQHCETYTSPMMNEASTQTDIAIKPSQESSSDAEVSDIKGELISFSTPKPRKSRAKKPTRKPVKSKFRTKAPVVRRSTIPNNAIDTTLKTLGGTRRKRQQNLPRSKTGCWTCRARRKKCDEEAPHCQACLKLGITCAGYGEPRPSFMLDSQKCAEYKEEVSRQIKASRRAKKGK